MNIEPKKDYKKPLYAIGAAALIGTTALLGTACGPWYSGGVTMYTTETEVEMLGETVTELTDDIELADDNVETEVVADGEIDVSCDPDVSCCGDEPEDTEETAEETEEESE